MEKFPDTPTKARRKHTAWRTRLMIGLGVVVVLLMVGRLVLPQAIRWYVNRTLDQNPLYQGQIGRLEVNLWRGAYTIEDVRMLKRTGNAAVPFIDIKRLDLALQWDALRHGRVVGRVLIIHPRLNFIAASNDANSQNGEGGPWLDMLRSLLPFKINRLLIRDGAVHFQAPDHEPPVDVFLSHVEASVENLTNVGGDLTPLFATIKAKGKVMDGADMELQMKVDPSSYYPTFELAVQLLGLDVTQLNAMAQAYGGFNFKQGWFDLVIEMNAEEGRLGGYVKPLFRNILVFDPLKDIEQDNLLQFFWQALVGGATSLLKNRPHDQFGTLIPLNGSMTDPRTDWLAAIGNVLRNAFIRAYLPKFQGVNNEINSLEFGTAQSLADPISSGKP